MDLVKKISEGEILEDQRGALEINDITWRQLAAKEVGLLLIKLNMLPLLMNLIRTLDGDITRISLKILTIMTFKLNFTSLLDDLDKIYTNVVHQVKSPIQVSIEYDYKQTINEVV